MPHTLVVEDQSRRLLESVLAPWPVTRWQQNDFGVDAVVEITAPVSNEIDREVTGRLFALQLKGTEKRTARVVRVRPGQLSYWWNHSLPFLLVSAHLPSGELRYRWIDDALLQELRQANPTFWGQTTVSVTLTERLTPESKASIERLATRFRARERAVSPGRYFELRQRVLETADALEDAAKDSGLRTVEDLVSDVRTTLRANAYTVGVVGPQRVGKSTLVNALLGVDVSPIADYPTTAIPLLFEAGSHPSAEVFFDDGKRASVEATSDALRPYAAQRCGDARRGNAVIVRATVPNESLSRGIALLDTPGMHDASERVRGLTESALRDADAILYVLDASLDAKFKLGRAEIEDLKLLQRSKERLLIVLNQSDALATARRPPLLEYVETELKKYGLWDDLPAPPMFVSGKEASDARIAKRIPPGEFVALEDALWGHLLRSRATGIDRLEQASARLVHGCEAATALLAERSTQGLEAANLDRARRACSRATAKIRAIQDDWRVSAATKTSDYLAGQRRRWLSELEEYIRRLPESAEPPTPEYLQTRMRREVTADVQVLWDYMQRNTKWLADTESAVVREALQATRADLGIPTQVRFGVLDAPLGSFDLSLPEVSVGFAGGLLGFLLHPLVGLATTVFGVISGLFVGHKRRRARVLAQATQKYDSALRTVHAQLADQCNERINASGRAIVHQAIGRLESFVDDCGRRLERLGAPLSTEEQQRIDEVGHRIVTLHADASRMSQDLQRLTVPNALAEQPVGSTSDEAAERVTDAGARPRAVRKSRATNAGSATATRALHTSPAEKDTSASRATMPGRSRRRRK